MKFIIAITLFALILTQTPLWGAGSAKSSLKSKYQTGMVELIPTLSINNDSLPDDQGMSNLTDFAISTKNLIFLLDGNQSKIKILSKTGEFLKSIGQKGDGPGDLAAPSLIISTDSQIIVWEMSGNRFSFFSPTGDFVKVVRVPSMMNIRKIHSLPDGQLVVEKEITDTVKGDTVYSQLDLYTKDAQFKASILKLPVNRYKNITEPMQLRIACPFTFDVAWDVSHSGTVVYGFQEQYRIYTLQMNNTNGSPSSFDHKADKIKINGNDKKIIEATYRMTTNRGIRDAPRELLDRIPYPGYRPIFGKIVVDSENNILVFPWKHTTVEYYEFFDAFDDSGKFIKRVKLATKILAPQKMIFDFSNRICFLTLDKNDEKSIIMYEFNLS